MPQADSAYSTIPRKPRCACPTCLAVYDDLPLLRPDLRDCYDLALLRRELRDCFEGCIPFREAIEMVGAPDRHRKTLRADWRRWTREFEV